MKTDEKTRREANAAIETGQARSFGKRVTGLEERVDDHEERIARVESEPPPGVTAPTVRRMTPAAPFRPAYRSDPELVRQLEEAEHERRAESEAQQRYAKGREAVDRELSEQLQDVRDDVADVKTGVAVLARAFGLEALLPATFRKSLPPPGPGGARKPELPSLRREVRIAGFLALALVVRDVVHDVHDVLVPLLKHLGAP